MTIVEAKILDSTHLELSQPILIKPGKYIRVSIGEEIDEEQLWLKTAKKRFLEAYDDQDSLYDEL